MDVLLTGQTLIFDQWQHNSSTHTRLSPFAGSSERLLSI